jgi:hypothetical protein
MPPTGKCPCTVALREVPHTADSLLVTQRLSGSPSAPRSTIPAFPLAYGSAAPTCLAALAITMALAGGHRIRPLFIYERGVERVLDAAVIGVIGENGRLMSRQGWGGRAGQGQRCKLAPDRWNADVLAGRYAIADRAS